MISTQITEDEIQAYIDGELDSEQYQKVEQYLLSHPDEAKRVADYQKINYAFRNSFENQLDSKISKQYSSNSFKQPKRNRFAKFSVTLQSLAASVAIFSFGAVSSGLFLSSELYQQTQTKLAVNTDQPRLSNNMTLATQAVYAHAVYSPEKKHPVEVTAKHEKHLVKWLSKRLKGKITIPHLTSLGFELVGGRLLPADNQTAAQFMYENSDKQRLTLYIKKNRDLDEISGFKFHQQDDLNSFYWIDENFGYVLIGNISKQKLTETAFKVYSIVSADTTI